MITVGVIMSLRQKKNRAGDSSGTYAHVLSVNV